MILLNKEVAVNIYEVVAEYKIKANKAPFIAILLLANSYEDKTLLTETLKEELLHPMTLPACKNILDRLCTMGYFSKKENDYPDKYQLTKLGMDAAVRKEFFEDRKGLIRIYIAKKNEFLPQRIIRVEELDDRHKFDSNERLFYLNEELKEIIHKKDRIPLRGKGNRTNGVFIMENFENQYRRLDSEKQTLSLEINLSNTKIKILNHEELKDDIQLYETKKEILINEFDTDYNSEMDILKINFNPEKLTLKRAIEIKKPFFSETIFNRINIKNMDVSPKHLMAAAEWHRALVLERMKNYKYFMSAKEFTDFSNRIAGNFKLFSGELKNIISREELIDQLEEENDFYLRAKLETINYLNY